MRNILKIKFLLLVVLLSSQFTGFGQGSPEEGKTLFRNYCATCHAKNMKTDATGPALAGVEERWADYPREDLYRWIRNSQQMINVEEHPRALELWNEWKPNVMNAFPNLTDENIESLLAYINVAANPPQVAGGPADGPGAVQEEESNTIYYILAAALVFLTIILARIISNLNVIALKRENPDAVVQRKTLIETLTSKGVISFLVFALIVIGGYKTVNTAINLGRQQGYAPTQPIKFSHETHAGLNQIECQYCHDGARRSKHSVIPAANTCMNCHEAIKVGSNYGTAEISKIFASIGYNPNSSTYIQDYATMPEDSIRDIFTTWIADNYISENNLAELDQEGENVVEEQWEEIKSSLTNEVKKEIPGPIEWVRIHNLPDHVYFNHAQHVTVGKVECQTCHGAVETMEVLQQYSPLSMGWCINCHRQTEVQFQDNPYYEAYEDYHQQLNSGEKDKVTVEDIGGLECQKCHY
ncbi:c-type cytochrome [Portibacter marinus]|uniref:c-type cytochrome n=1 Tax=Portibacter marinus TaxID=2898660 RepID=UPI001F1BCB8F|nr:c-type cytochrome [Portibacter marinus]